MKLILFCLYFSSFPLPNLITKKEKWFVKKYLLFNMNFTPFFILIQIFIFYFILFPLTKPILNDLIFTILVSLKCWLDWTIPKQNDNTGDKSFFLIFIFILIMIFTGSCSHPWNSRLWFINRPESEENSYELKTETTGCKYVHTRWLCFFNG